jgi:putative membrane protein insertion efficiency factor
VNFFWVPPESEISSRWGGRLAAFLGSLVLLLPNGALAGGLRAPDEIGQQLSAVEVVETSPLKLGLQGAVWLYQKGVSPVNPDRCGFQPSCSAYGSLAVREHGPFWGLLLTADRLLRCHPLKKPGPSTVLLPNGKILDLPPGKSLPDISEP